MNIIEHGDEKMQAWWIVSPWQVKAIVMSQDSNKNSILASAMASNNAGIFNATMACTEQYLTPQEVRSLIT